MNSAESMPSASTTCPQTVVATIFPGAWRDDQGLQLQPGRSAANRHRPRPEQPEDASRGGGWRRVKQTAPILQAHVGNTAKAMQLHKRPHQRLVSESASNSSSMVTPFSVREPRGSAKMGFLKRHFSKTFIQSTVQRDQRCFVGLPVLRRPWGRVREVSGKFSCFFTCSLWGPD